ncbi:FG-GAP-like repeat-containing protein [Leptospira sp. WS60.C2]
MMAKSLFLKTFQKVIFAIVILLFLSNCWTNPLTHPPIECLMKLENWLCSDKNDLRLYSPAILISLLPESRLTISNLTNHSIVETGFVVGTAPSDVSFVNVGYDYSPITQVPVINGTWKYALPAKAVNHQFWTYGSVHTIFAQIPLEKPITIRVRKGTNKDIDGDGYPDLIVSATRSNSDQGYIYVYKTNPNTKLLETIPSTSITDGVTGTFFGSQVSSGDINGDGYADILVGAQAYNAASGRVYEFLSRGVSGIPSRDLNAGGISDAILDATVGSGRLGTNIKCADMNHDGFDDVILASPWNDDVFLFYSQGQTGIPSQNTNQANLTYKPGANDNFGTFANFGDINGDGHMDLIVSASTYSSNLGRAYIYISNHGSLPSEPQQFLYPPNNLTPSCSAGVGCNFGTSFVLDDWNQDQCIDLAIGANTYNDNQGIVFIYYSSCDATNPYPNPPVATLIGQPTGSCSSTNCFFGASLSSGDSNGDGLPDLLVGATGASSGIGDVNLFLNHPNTGFPSLDLGNGDFGATLFAGETSGSNFSFKLGFQDTNADGLQDIVISEPTSTNLVYTFHSIRGSVPASQNLNNTGVASQALSPPLGFGLGHSIALWKETIESYLIAFTRKTKRFFG